VQDQEGKQLSCGMSTLLQECDISGAGWSMTKQIVWRRLERFPSGKEPPGEIKTQEINDLMNIFVGKAH
jgi:hypothetical protein